MTLLYMLSAGIALIIASLVIVLLLLRAVSLLERIANAFERQDRHSDDIGTAASRDRSTPAPPPDFPYDS